LLKSVFLESLFLIFSNKAILGRSLLDETVDNSSPRVNFSQKLGEVLQHVASKFPKQIQGICLYSLDNQ